MTIEEKIALIVGQLIIQLAQAELERVALTRQIAELQARLVTFDTFHTQPVAEPTE